MQGRKNDDTREPEPGLWEMAMADVTPMPGRKPRKTGDAAARPGTTHAAPSTAARKAARPVATPPTTPRAHLGTPHEQARDLDRRTQTRLTRGQMDIEATLDLHGDTQDVAMARLRAFLTQRHAQGMRCVLVITGKGRGGAGVLRSRLPEWVDEAPLRAIVLRAEPARPEHGGTGAFYVLLRRARG